MTSLLRILVLLVVTCAVFTVADHPPAPAEVTPEIPVQLAEDVSDVAVIEENVKAVDDAEIDDEVNPKSARSPCKHGYWKFSKHMGGYRHRRSPTPDPKPLFGTFGFGYGLGYGQGYGYGPGYGYGYPAYGYVNDYDDYGDYYYKRSIAPEESSQQDETSSRPKRSVDLAPTPDVVPQVEDPVSLKESPEIVRSERSFWKKLAAKKHKKKHWKREVDVADAEVDDSQVNPRSPRSPCKHKKIYKKFGGYRHKRSADPEPLLFGGYSSSFGYGYDHHDYGHGHGHGGHHGHGHGGHGYGYGYGHHHYDYDDHYHRKRSAETEEPTPDESSAADDSSAIVEPEVATEVAEVVTEIPPEVTNTWFPSKHHHRHGHRSRGGYKGYWHGKHHSQGDHSGHSHGEHEEHGHGEHEEHGHGEHEEHDHGKHGEHDHTTHIDVRADTPDIVPQVEEASEVLPEMERPERSFWHKLAWKKNKKKHWKRDVAAADDVAVEEQVRSQRSPCKHKSWQFSKKFGNYRHRRSADPAPTDRTTVYVPVPHVYAEIDDHVDDDYHNPDDLEELYDH